jgi:hypothetical protein
MNAITNTWQGLVQRRLWPVALVLLAALVAVPVVLAEDPAPAPAPVATAPVSEDPSELASAPIVAVAAAEQREQGRDVVGKRKNPFEPAAQPKAAKAATAKAGTETGTPATRTTTASGSKPAASGGTGGGASAPTPVPAPVAPSTPKPTYETFSLTVRFGDATGATLDKQNLKRLTALPSVDEPALIYLGLLADAKTAVFLLDASAMAQGDGVCKPRASDCQTIHLREGETEFIDVTNANGAIKQYQLDLVDIKRKKTTSAKAAKAVAVGARKALRGRAALASAYEFELSSGTLLKRPAKASGARVLSGLHR